MVFQSGSSAPMDPHDKMAQWWLLYRKRRTLFSGIISSSFSKWNILALHKKQSDSPCFHCSPPHRPPSGCNHADTLILACGIQTTHLTFRTIRHQTCIVYQTLTLWLLCSSSNRNEYPSSALTFSLRLMGRKQMHICSTMPPSLAGKNGSQLVSSRMMLELLQGPGDGMRWGISASYSEGKLGMLKKLRRQQ